MSRLRREVKDIARLHEGTLIKDGTGERLVKTTSGWRPEGLAHKFYTSEAVIEFGEVTIISTPEDWDPEDVAVAEEFIVQGPEWAPDHRDSRSLYFMTDGTIRWVKP